MLEARMTVPDAAKKLYGVSARTLKGWLDATGITPLSFPGSKMQFLTPQMIEEAESLCQISSSGGVSGDEKTQAALSARLKRRAK